MNGTIFTQVNYALSSLIQKIELGEIGLPDLQRPFVWPNAKVRDLFDSMYRGFPVGYLLFWESGASDVSTHKIGTDPKQKIANLLIVDGQQRLTSLYAVLKGVPVVQENYTSERIQIAFRPMNQKFEVSDAAIKKDIEFIPDISVLWHAKTSIFSFIQTFIARLQAQRAVDPDEVDRIAAAITALHNLGNYPFIALELSASISEEQVAEVFVRINSKGATLNQADFILTLMSVYWEDGRKELEAFCRHARRPAAAGSIPSPYNHFIRPAPDQLLRVGVGLAFRRAPLEHVYSVLRGKNMTTREFSATERDAQFAVLKTAQSEMLGLTNWHEFFNCLRRAGYRREGMISSAMAILYSYTMYLIGKRDFAVPHGPLREVIARWFFMVSLTSRYGNSPESEMAKNLNFLSGVTDAAGFIALLNGIIDATLTPDYWAITLPNDLATSSARSPSLFAYYAALHLLDAKVLFSALKVSVLFDPVIYANKAALERHHLFPKGFLKTKGIIETRDANQIANFALVEWGDNIDISDKDPAEYFPPLSAAWDAAEFASMSYWHALPADWECMDYPDFLEARRKLIAAVIHDAFKLL